MRAGVLGATSMIGPPLLELLLKKNFKVSAFSRSLHLPCTNRDQDLTWYNLSNFHNDALKNIDILFSLCPISAVPDLLAQCISVTKLVALSTSSVDYKNESADSLEKIETKITRQAEEKVQEICDKNDISFTILRPTMIYHLGFDKNLTQIFNFIKVFKVFPIVGDGKGTRQPILAEDVAKAIVMCHFSPKTKGKVLYLTGPETLSYKMIVNKIFEKLKYKPVFLHIPFWLARSLFSFLNFVKGNQYSNQVINRINLDLCFFDNTLNDLLELNLEPLRLELTTFQKPLKILQFGRFSFSEKKRGIPRHVQELSHGLTKNGFEVTNLVVLEEPKLFNILSKTYSTVFVRSMGNLLGTAIAPFFLFKAIIMHKRKKFDVFHLHFPDPLTHLASMFLPRNVPRVITWHSDIIRQRRIFTFYRPFLNREVKNAKAIIAATKKHFDNSKQIPKNFPNNKKHIFPFGLEFLDFHLNSKAEKKIQEIKQKSNGKGIVFFVGEHVEYKGLEYLIQAAVNCDIFLVIGGTGPLTEYLETQVAEFGIKHRTWFVGMIPDDEIYSFYQACDIFCLPSINQSEAFGLVQLEAMYCKKPIISTQLRNGVNEVSIDGQTGMVVPPEDSVAITNCINTLLKDRDLSRRLGENGKKRVVNHFSCKQMIENHERLYKSLIQN